jgi:3-hydroxyisobutyrate dehydrogenase-like beta-hydroxyacid dehydrogenase
MIIVAGDLVAFEAAETSLRIIAPDLEYVGEDVGVASALDCAILSVTVGVMLGTMQGIAVARAHRSLESFGRLMKEFAPLFAHDVDHMTSVVREEEYGDPPASVATWQGVMHRLREHAADEGLDPAFPALAAAVFDRAMVAGFGNQEPAIIADRLLGG